MAGKATVASVLPTPVDFGDDVVESAPLITGAGKDVTTINVTPAAYDDSPTESMVEVLVLSDDGNDYVAKQVTLSEAQAMQASVGMDYNYLGGTERAIETYGYDQRFAYYFCEGNPDSKGYQEAMTLGYRPVPEKVGIHNPAHKLREFAGIGKSAQKFISFGDGLFMRIPKDHKNAIDAARDLQVLMRRDPDAARKQGEAILDSHGLSHDAKSGVVDSATGWQADKKCSRDEELSRLQEQAQAFLRAKSFSDRQANGQETGTGMTFGGFQGKAVPPSRMNIVGRPVNE